MKILLCAALAFILSCQDQSLNYSAQAEDASLTKRVAGVRYLDDVFTSVITTNDVTYGSAVNPYTGNSETLKLNIYRPSGDTETQKWAIVYAHGGGFVQGSKSQSQNVDLCTRLAKKGYIVFNIDYRLLPLSMRGAWNAGTPLVGADFRAAIRFVRLRAAQYGVNVNRITSFGSSAGSFGALAAAYDAALDPLISSNPAYASDPNLGPSCAGALPAVGVIESGEAPMYLMNCTIDPVMPFSMAEDVYDQAVSVGVSVETFWLVEECHTFIDTATDRQETASRLATWIFNQFN